MRWFIPTFAMGVLTLLLYAASWVCRIMHWPGADILRYSALGAFIFGVFLLAIYNLSKKKAEDRDDFDDWINRDE